MKRLFTALVAALATVILVPAPAGAAQLSAGEWPTFSGPVAAAQKTCTNKTDRTDSGLTIAVLKACAYSFSLQPEAETDDANDYGAIWVQSEVQPRNNFCIRRINTDLRINSQMAVHSRKPAARTATERRRVRVRLRLDAQGAIQDDTGIVRNRFIMYPGELTRRQTFNDDTNTRTLRLRWVGRSGKKLAFASGAEVSWATGDDPGVFSYGLRYIAGRRRC